MAARGQCRIIAGQWRGRKIRFHDSEGLRPTTDRIRETLFNWLQGRLAGSICLDAFAGSGALGFEAASRHAAHVVMLEKNRRGARQLAQTAAALGKGTMGEGTVSVHQADALAWLAQPATQRFDIVFLDPPFASGLLEAAVRRLAEGQWLAPRACVYIEQARGDSIAMPASWQCLKSANAGQVAYALWRPEPVRLQEEA